MLAHNRSFDECESQRGYGGNIVNMCETPDLFSVDMDRNPAAESGVELLAYLPAILGNGIDDLIEIFGWLVTDCFADAC